MDRLLRGALVIYASLLAVPLRFFAIEPGLDPSWAFALKYFHSRGLKFGEDIGFTWGPLGHLAIAMDVNGGLVSAIIVQVTGWAGLVVSLAYVAFRRRLAMWRVVAFAVLTYAGAKMFRSFGYAGFDFFLSWLVLMLIGCASVARRWWLPFGCAALLASLLMLMKLSTGIAAVSAVLAYPAGLLLTGRVHAARTAGIAVIGCPLLFIGAYLFHNPSLSGMARYIKAGFELSSEHSTILSLPGSPAALYLALGLLGCYVALTLLLLWTRNAAFPLAAAMAGPLFLEFKHSFIREPGHVEMLFFFMPLVAAVLVLFVTAQGWTKHGAMGILIAFGALLVYVQRGALNNGLGLQQARPLLQLHNLQAVRAILKQQSAANLAVDRLPADLLGRVRNQTVAIFPWESSYAAANQLNYKPFPIFQAYDAYTPYLDRWNAEFFDNSIRAPQFVLFDWHAIDERHPLLDVPQTALSLYRNYELDGTFGSRLLLRRLRDPRFSKKLKSLRRGTVRIREKLELNQAANASVVALHLNWDLAGALKKFFWRLPEIRWIATFGDGSALSARVPPAVISGGVAVDLIPTDLSRTQELFAGGPGRQVESVIVAGEGARYLRPDLAFEVSILERVAVKAVPPATARIAPVLRSDCKIDFINNAAVEAGGGVSANAATGVVVVRGWALSALDILLRIDGRMRRAETGKSRPDVVAAFRQDPRSRPGFELTIPAVDLPGPVHRIEAFVLNAAGLYQTCSQPVLLTLH